jgi:hypothetical protein
MDAIEYLLNFIERIEEGLAEDKPQMSVQNVSSEKIFSLNSDAKIVTDEPLDPVNQSYFENTELVEEDPL